MNWYKIAIDIRDFHDRNVVNDKIHFLREIQENLKKLAKVVFQNGKYAKAASFSIAENKTLSSFPKVRDILLQADIVALDSPWKFADLCREAADEAGHRANKMEKERKRFIEKELPHRMKGWVDRQTTDEDEL